VLHEVLLSVEAISKPLTPFEHVQLQYFVVLQLRWWFAKEELIFCDK
jgi:hypothetical protein